MINKKRLVKTFKELVRIDSLSLKEGKVMKSLKRELRKMGLKSYDAGWPEGGEAANLAVDVPGRGLRKPRIMLNAHVDTVGPGKKIKPIERGNKIFTNGKTILGADDKAGVAVILELLKVLKENKLQHPPLRIILTVAEETGLYGAKAIPKRLLNADFGITLDHGPVDHIINQAPSQVNVTATILGRAAHAGIHPEAGINAIKVAAEAITRMKFGRIDDETTSNIGVINGGKATNIVPDKVVIRGEARSHNKTKMWRQIKQMQQVLLKTCKKYGAGLKVSVPKIYSAFEVKPEKPVARLACAALRRAGYEPRLEPTGGGSDANILNAAGIPTLNMGVGMHRVHTKREYANIKEMVQGAEIVLDIITGTGK